MQKPIRITLSCYYSLFHLIAAVRTRKEDLDLRRIHALTVTVLTTGILMWAYAFLSWFHISSPVVREVGFICCIIHIFSPLLFRITNRHLLITNIMLGAGLVHMSIFAYYSGGSSSVALIWFASLPMLAGIISGINGAVTWAIIAPTVTAAFLVLDQMNYPFPNIFSSKGRIMATVLIQFAFIMITSVVTYIYVNLQDNAEARLKEQKRKIDDLFKVLFHDLANPLGRMGIGLSIVKKHQIDPQASRGMEIMTQATQSMLEITHNVRKMYALSQDKVGMEMMPTSLNESVEYLRQFFAHELSNKQLALLYNPEQHQDLKLLVEPISFKNQVLANIISNAIKFSHPGGKIHIKGQINKAPLCSIIIRDEGVGIPQHVIPHIFDNEKRTNRSGTLGEAGNGCGLQIMKSFVEMYGGMVTINSVGPMENSPPGTTITITLNGSNS